MVTKAKAGAKAQKKGRAKVGKLKLNKETVINLSPLQKKALRGGLGGKKGSDTVTVGCVPK